MSNVMKTDDRRILRFPDTRKPIQDLEAGQVFECRGRTYEFLYMQADKAHVRNITTERFVILSNCKVHVRIARAINNKRTRLTQLLASELHK